RKVDGGAKLDLEAAAQTECDLSIECSDKRDPVRKAAADERGERARSERARRIGQEGTRLQLGGRWQPDAGQLWPASAFGRLDDAPSCRDEPRLAPASEHGDGHLWDDADPDRVREGAVDDRTANSGERISALLDRPRIDGHEAPALVGAKGGADVRRDCRGC